VLCLFTNARRKNMNPLPTYKENGELDTRLRVDPVTGDVGIGTPKEKKYMTKDEAVILLCEHFSEGMVRTIVDAIAKDEALEKKDEPVAWMNRHGACKTSLFMEVEAGAKEEYTIPVYTQPQRTWVGLTDEDLKPICDEWRIVYGAWMDDFARDIEAKLKEKNHGNS